MDDKREVTSKDVMYWNTLEHIHVKKTSDWYWIVSIITLIVVLTALFFENYTFAAVMVFAVVVLFMQDDSGPEKLEIGLNNKGIYVNEKFYAYSEIDSFHIEDGFGVPRILIKSKKIFTPLIVIPFDEEVDRDDLEYFLGYYVDKEILHESRLQIFMESLGF